MAKNAMVFAMANPVPEILPDEASRSRCGRDRHGPAAITRTRSTMCWPSRAFSVARSTCARPTSTTTCLWLLPAPLRPTFRKGSFPRRTSCPSALDKNVNRCRGESCFRSGPRLRRGQDLSRRSRKKKPFCLPSPPAYRVAGGRVFACLHHFAFARRRRGGCPCVSARLPLPALLLQQGFRRAAPASASRAGGGRLLPAVMYHGLLRDKSLQK